MDKQELQDQIYDLEMQVNMSKGRISELRTALAESEKARQDAVSAIQVWAKDAQAMKSRAEAAEFALAEARKVCAEVYQWAGAYDAPSAVLDNLSDAASGSTLCHKTVLPIAEPDHLTRLFAAESALAALQEENVRYLDAIGKIRAAYHNICNTTNVKTRDFWNTFGEIVELADQALSTTPETAKVQAVIEAARGHEMRARKKGNDHERHAVMSGDDSKCVCDICEAVRDLNK
jgi:hypothetical protein